MKRAKLASTSNIPRGNPRTKHQSKTLMILSNSFEDYQTKAQSELSPTAKAMQRQRELREWKKTQKEKEPNSGKRSLETSPTIADEKVNEKRKANRGKDDQKGTGESEIEDKKVESEQESMETESI